MKKVFFVIFLFLFIEGCNYTQQKEFPKLTGPYLGQKPPGITPELFAPVIFEGEVHSGFVFSPDGNEVYWNYMNKVGIFNIVFMRIENNIWTQPVEVPFRSEYGTSDPTFSPDGKKLFFTSRESVDGGRRDDEENIWYVEKQNGIWGKPKPLSHVVNSYSLHWQLSVAANGNLYFARDDIYLARFVNGKYEIVEKLGASINSKHIDCTPFIAPDESYLIFNRLGDTSGADLFISFKKEDGTWTKAKNMGPAINTGLHELCPNVTPDGKYLFFNRNGEDGDLKVFWVDAKIIDKLRSKQ